MSFMKERSEYRSWYLYDAKGREKMYQGKLTPREEEILRELLTKQDINDYLIVGAVAEGHDLPGSSYPGEIEWLSGKVITLAKAYFFWLDWKPNEYYFRSWGEYPPEMMKDREIRAAQLHLRRVKGLLPPEK